MEDLEHWTELIKAKHHHIRTCVLCRHYDGKLTEGSADCLEYILLHGKSNRAYLKWMNG